MNELADKYETGRTNIELNGKKYATMLNSVMYECVSEIGRYVEASGVRVVPFNNRVTIRLRETGSFDVTGMVHFRGGLYLITPFICSDLRRYKEHEENFWSLIDSLADDIDCKYDVVSLSTLLDERDYSGLSEIYNQIVVFENIYQR